jgi:tetratricopeptide (TPR) repeat protein
MTEAAEELAERVGESLKRIKDDQDTAAFKEVADIVLNLVDSDLPHMAGNMLHALCLVISARWPEGDLFSDNPVASLLEDLNNPISSFWQRPEIGRVYYLAGRVAVGLSQWEAGQEFFSKSLEFFSGSGMGIDIALAHQALAGVYSMQGDRQLAVASSKKALDFYRSVGDKGRAAEVFLNLAQDSLWESPQAAAEYLDNAEREIVRLNDGHLNAALLGLRAMVHVQFSNYMAAEPLLRKAIASARRRGDSLQEQQSAQNLANVIDEAKGPQYALPWRLKALSIAETRGDTHAEATLHRAVALTLARLKNTVGAIEHLKSCLELSTNLGDKRMGAEAAADLGAMILSRETGVVLTFSDEDSERKDDPDLKRGRALAFSQPDLEQLDHALKQFDLALEIFLELRDSEWISRVATNRRNLLQLRDSSQAVRDLLNISRRVRDFDQVLATDLIREAARTECAAGVDPSFALELYTQFAASQSTADSAARAWALLEAAAELAQLGGFHEQAAKLLNEAALIYTRLDDPINAATALNDYGVALHHSGDDIEATAAFRKVIQIADEQDNRVLKEMALNNLAQLMAEAGEVDEAVTYFSEAASIAAALGDHQSSADHWCSVSGLLLNSGALDEVGPVLQRARQQADLDGSPEAASSVQSAEASRAFATSNYEEAAALWYAAGERSPARRRFERLSFALDAQARAGNSIAYRENLAGYSARAQSEGARQTASELLWRPALTWLQAGDAKNAAQGLATAGLLTLAEMMETRRRIDFARLGEATSVPPPLKSFYVTLAQIASVLTFEDVPPSMQLKCRKLVVRSWHRSHGPEVSEFLDQRLKEAEEPLSGEE